MIAILRSERTKFFSYGWSMVGVAGAIIIPLVFLLTSDLPKLGGERGLLTLTLQAQYLGQLGMIVASASYFGQEFSHSSLRTTFLSQPSRLKLLSVKFINITGIAVITGIISIILNVMVLSFQIDVVWTKSFLLSLLVSISLGILSMLQLAWLASAISLLTKSLITPIAIILPLILGLGQMLLQFVPLAKFLPNLATMNLYILPAVDTYLEKGTGLGIQFAWVGLFVAISSWLFLTRDVR